MEDFGKSEGEDRLQVVALGTGTNCLGKNETSAEGLLVHDSHAEVLCRRAFIDYLMEEMSAALSTEKNEPSIFRQKATATTSKTERTSLDGSEASGPKKARIDCSQVAIESSLPRSGNSEAVTFDLRQGVAFHFYSSHPPCGDATISPKE